MQNSFFFVCVVSFFFWTSTARDKTGLPKAGWLGLGPPTSSVVPHWTLKERVKL
jgi:hypothetical protein